MTARPCPHKKPITRSPILCQCFECWHQGHNRQVQLPYVICTTCNEVAHLDIVSCHIGDAEPERSRKESE